MEYFVHMICTCITAYGVPHYVGRRKGDTVENGG